MKVKGLQEILKVIGGRKQWSEELQEEVDKKLKALGYLSDKEEIEEQMKTALEAYTLPTSEERKIVTAQKGGLKAYFELCKHHDLRTDASANKLRGEFMELGKPSKTRKEVKENLINLEAKRTRLAEMVKDKSGELQPEWLKTILMQMLDNESRMHLGEEIGKDHITYEEAKARITDFITLNEDDGKAGLNNLGSGAKKEKEFNWDKPYEEWDAEQLRVSLDALKGGGNKGSGKGNCWNCGKPGHRAFECWNPLAEKGVRQDSSAPKGAKAKVEAKP